MSILKVAVGVFLGGMAIFLAINAPGWIDKARHEKWYADARKAVDGLTPDLLIQRCGKPQKDVTDKTITTRFIRYNDQSVVLRFFQMKDGSWFFTGMELGDIYTIRGSTFSEGTRINGDPGKNNDAFHQIAILPCLENEPK